MTIEVWVTCEGKRIDTSGIHEVARELIRKAVRIYWATVCPEVPSLATIPPMEWTSFAQWWLAEFQLSGLKHSHGDLKSPAFEILQDLEARIGIHQGKVAKPEKFCPSYWPFWA